MGHCVCKLFYESKYLCVHNYMVNFVNGIFLGNASHIFETFSFRQFFSSLRFVVVAVFFLSAHSFVGSHATQRQSAAAASLCEQFIYYLLSIGRSLCTLLLLLLSLFVRKEFWTCFRFVGPHYLNRKLIIKLSQNAVRNVYTYSDLRIPHYTTNNYYASHWLYLLFGQAAAVATTKRRKTKYKLFMTCKLPLGKVANEKWYV